MKVYDLKGNIVKKLKRDNKYIYFIRSYYDKKITRKNYIISCGYQHLTSYDFEKNSIYHDYVNTIDDIIYGDFAIFDSDKIIKLIGANDKGFIYIWNYNSGIVLDTIKIIFGIEKICLWNNNYLFVLCKYDPLKLIDLNKKIIVKSFGDKGNMIKTIEKFIHPIYGPSLIILNYTGEINLWAIKK